MSDSAQNPKTATSGTNVTFTGHQKGRSDIQNWAASQVDNFFTSDSHFLSLLSLYKTEGKDTILEEDLTRLGEQSAGPIDALARENNLHTNLPRLERFTAHGERVESVAHHPTYHEIGKMVYGSGAMSSLGEEANVFGALCRMYISSHNGEAGHNCPFACTAGVIRVLQKLATPEIKERFLPGFLNRNYGEHLEGAQFLTEIQGGSDVGANASLATMDEDGTWRVYGEKWFCSNIDSDVFLMSARITHEQKEGTRGLGLFLVPRRLEDGSINEFYVRRLKDKLGTRSMASGECDFRGAQAYHMGEIGEGFKNMITLVINTSRLYNAIACAGAARRAYLDAQRYACHRQAFGQAIVNYPLVQETLANMRAEVDAMVSGSMYLMAMQDRADLGECTPEELGFLRMGINLNKMLTSKSNRWVVEQGIEIFGGNGAIESFSILPRLLRDSIVFENWEGTHNTLLMQCMRDMHKYQVHVGYLNQIEKLIETSEHRQRLQAVVDRVRAALDRISTSHPASASLLFRPTADTMTYLMQAAVRAWELEQLGEDAPEDARASLEHLIELRLDEGLPSYNEDYVSRIATLANGF